MFKDPEFRELFAKAVLEWQKQRDVAETINFVHRDIRDKIHHSLKASIDFTYEDEEGNIEAYYQDNDASQIINRQTNLIEPQDGGDELIIRVFMESQELMDKYRDLLEKMYNDEEKTADFQFLAALFQ